jgi:hypothetical protein
MPKPTLGDVIKAVPDPLLSDNYTLSFPSVPTGDDAIPLLMQCKSASKPGYTINAVEVQLFGHTVEHAGNKTFGHDMTVEYVENRSLQIHNILEKWGEMVRGTQSQHGAFKSEYVRDGYLTIFDQKGNVVSEYVIENCWPSVVPESPFDGTASNIITLSITFKYDVYYNKTTGVGR